MSNNYIWSIDRILSGVTSPGHSGPGSDGNEGLLYIAQISRITGASSLDCLVSYLVGRGAVLPFCKDAVGIFYSRLGCQTIKTSHYKCII